MDGPFLQARLPDLGVSLGNLSPQSSFSRAQGKLEAQFTWMLACIVPKWEGTWATCQRQKHAYRRNRTPATCVRPYKSDSDMEMGASQQRNEGPRIRKHLLEPGEGVTAGQLGGRAEGPLPLTRHTGRGEAEGGAGFQVKTVSSGRGLDSGRCLYVI